ncbi:MAG TPA: NUDIX domain-containing protein [Jatrophihabitans sp.]|jgi:predicted NUDIX family NTP pyrophosphohydrolase|nr:NUDIX domain-containing protein [Jatrophihabitans sp.]
MGAQSAGLLLFRRSSDGVEVLLGHMGGPFFARRDAGAWSIPKGEYDADEQPLAAARREFEEEFGAPAPSSTLLELGTVRQRNGKRVTAWAVESDFDAAAVVSNTFELEWPPRSGRVQSFPEVDRAEWFDVETARTKMVVGQDALLDRLLTNLQ